MCLLLVLHSFTCSYSRYTSNLKVSDKFNDGDKGREPPTTLLWSLFLKSHLLEKSGLITEALAVIEECVSHTPTALDMYIKKAKILRKLGDVQAAAETLRMCSNLDQQDRYLNNKATKYLLRADLVEDAMQAAAKFIRTDSFNGNVQQALCHYQCSWYEVELAESYQRQGKLGQALKKFMDIHAHYKQYCEDQHDFHSYSLRKTTLRAYLDILQIKDKIFGSKLYQRATRGVISIYLSLIDGKKGAGFVAEEEEDETSDLSHLTPAERKKEKARRRKLKKKAEYVSNGQTVDIKRGTLTESTAGGEGVRADDDPQGEKLLSLDPLNEACKWCLRVQRLRNCEASTHASIAEVMRRRGKLVSALRNIICGFRQEPRHPQLTLQLVKLATVAFESEKEENISSMSPTERIALKVVHDELVELLGGSDIYRFALEFAGS